MTWHILILAVATLWLAGFAGPSQAGSGLTGAFADRAPMFEAAARPLVAPDTGPSAGRASLFAGRQEGGLFSTPRARTPDGASLRRGSHREGSLVGDGIRARLRDLVASAEAGRAGYDAVQSGARRPPPHSPTAMTLGEIFAWIEATPGQHHAIGRYQIIPETLQRLVVRAGLDADTRFGPAVQDRLADLLLADAGLEAMQRGEIPRAAFMLNLAKVWAGLPTPSGRSYYHGVAGNRAVLSYDSYATAVGDILDG